MTEELIFGYLPGAVLLLALAVIFYQGRQLARLRQRLAACALAGERTAAGLRRDLEAIIHCNRGVNDTLHEHNRVIRQILWRQESLEMHDSGVSRYREAVTLIRKGADKEDLVSACGLSRGEAELVAHLNHLQRKASY